MGFRYSSGERKKKKNREIVIRIEGGEEEEDRGAKTCFQTFRHHPRTHGPLKRQGLFFLSFPTQHTHGPYVLLLFPVSLLNCVLLLLLLLFLFLLRFPDFLHLLFTPFRGSFSFYTSYNLAALSLPFSAPPPSLTNPAPFLILNGGPLYNCYCYCRYCYRYCSLHSSLLFFLFITSTGRLKCSPLLSRMQ